MIAISINTNDTGMFEYIKQRANSYKTTYTTSAVMVNTAGVNAPKVTMPSTDSFSVKPEDN